MVEIEIFLSLHGTQVSFLSIPRSDIDRLAVFPFRWMRYVMFTICGARGDLFPTPNGSPVDYDKTEFADSENTFYYRPSEDCAFVDHQGLSDQLTSSELTHRRHGFRADVIRRDGDACVVTQVAGVLCDAVHLIPRSKGEEYIARVIQLRSPGDDSAPPSDVEIDHITNGMLLRKDLHAALGLGQVAFIKTPNYGLRPGDIRKFQRGGSRPDYITLHQLKRPENYDPTLSQTLQGVDSGDAHWALGANVDALFQGKGGSPPSTVILDYAYGVAAYTSWHSKRGHLLDVMNDYHKTHYADIPSLLRAPPDDTYGPVDPNDPDYKPPGPRECYRRRDESNLAEAMDQINEFLMYMHGITPEEAAERRQKEIEQEERVAQEASRSKVMEWRKYMDVH